MKTSIISFIYFAFASAQLIPFDQSLPSLIDPILEAQAGQELMFDLSNFRNATCEATLSFQNLTFLPISATARPHNCAGDQVARLRIPPSAPNGTAAIQWQCVGAEATSFALLEIFGGAGDYEAFQMDSESTQVMVNCKGNLTWAGIPVPPTTC